MAKPTKDDLIALASRYEEPSRSVKIAVGEFNNGIPVDQNCPSAIQRFVYGIPILKRQIGSRQHAIAEGATPSAMGY
jgi:hypothetical protein